MSDAAKPGRGGGIADGDADRGVVLRDEGSQLIVDIAGEEVPCVVRKTLRRKTGKRRKAVAVGDRVTIERSGEGAAIMAVDPRGTSLSRPDPSQPRREQILVANLDTVLIVASAKRPDLVPNLIDRFLVAAESRGIDVGIAINKIDLDEARDYGPYADYYRALGYTVLEVSAVDERGLEDVRAFLAGHTTSLLGHSGVGKSSLANALDPSLRLRIGAVQEQSGKGTHTTTTVSLLRLPWGGYLVDTPGIREFGLWRMELVDVALWFREMAERADSCRFNDCLHEAEPQCAVRAAVEAGDITAWRYESYRAILQSLRRDARPDY